MDTIRSGIVNPDIYSVFVAQTNNDSSLNSTWSVVSQCDYGNNHTMIDTCTELTRAEFYYGELGALSGTAAWLIAAGL
jgi:hypothetical protein